MIEVEHIVPLDNGGDELNWENFLLSCKYCNTVKKARNIDRVGYLWPDRDNTDLVFNYSETNIIEPVSTLTAQLTNFANATIDLMGLDRVPGGVNEPTEADTRWVIRQQAWDKAKKSYNNWVKLPNPVLAHQIGITSLDGNYSIWCEVFKNEPDVLIEIDLAYTAKGLYKQYEADGLTRTRRPNSQI